MTFYDQQGYPYNSEGTLFYPGTAINYDGPVPSMRLKVLRNGAQDYEYFALLASAGLSDQALVIVSRVVSSWLEWSHDPQDYYNARADLAALLAP